MKPHEPVHLKLDLDRDVRTFERKKRVLWLLKTGLGGCLIGPPESYSFCGAFRPRASVPWRERTRVTCQRCIKTLLLRQLDLEAVNPRSGMRMPRPTEPTPAAKRARRNGRREARRREAMRLLGIEIAEG